MKQILRLLGGLFFLIFALFTPITTCVQKVSTHREKEAVVTKVESRRTEGRRGRLKMEYRLRYTYEVDGTSYDGYDPDYDANGNTQPGENVRIVYNLGKPGDSHISENGGQDWFKTSLLLGISGYMFFGFYRGRRMV
jgi:hypothetical protein